MEDMQKMEKDQNSVLKQILKSCKVQSVEEVTHAALMKPSCCSKDTLASFVEKLLKLSISNLESCRTAAVKIDELKSERIVVQKTVIDLQREQLHQVQDAVKSSVKDSVKTEITMWSDIVKKNVTSAAPSVASVQKAVRSAVEDNVRSNNFIIYGVEEEKPDEDDEEDECENGGLENCVDVARDLYNEILAFPRPDILTATRVGPEKSLKNAGSRKPRPIKVTLASPEAVKFVLSKASKLKGNACDHWRCVYLAPDQSKEERQAHSKLVAELKQKISEDSSKYHSIRDGKIISVDRALSSSKTKTNTEE